MKMLLNDLMKRKQFTQYRLAKASGVPYTTVHDICSGKAKIEKCSAETVYKIAKVLDISVERLLEPYLEKRGSFELFKSNICHRLKELGDIAFIMDVLEQNSIRSYYDKEWYAESFYLLAMLDYLSRINGIPLCSEYQDLRRCSLQETIYPSSVVAFSLVEKSDRPKEDARKSSIPEFLHYNIVENEVRNVV